MFGFGKRDPIPVLCRRSGWMVVQRQADRYWVRSCTDSAGATLRLSNGSGRHYICFHGDFPVRFSLERPPSGLFARLLMRNLDLLVSGWCLNIHASCEAQLYLMAQLPVAGMTPELFGTVCQEIAGELDGFHQELREKFKYGLGGIAPPAAPAAAADDIRFIETTRPGSSLPSIRPGVRR